MKNLYSQYELVDPRYEDYTPFYVGKGAPNRLTIKAKRNVNVHVRIEEILSEGYAAEDILLVKQTFEEEVESFKAEAERYEVLIELGVPLLNEQACFAKTWEERYNEAMKKGVSLL